MLSCSLAGCKGTMHSSVQQLFVVVLLLLRRKKEPPALDLGRALFLVMRRHSTPKYRKVKMFVTRPGLLRNRVFVKRNEIAVVRSCLRVGRDRKSATRK